MKRLALIFCTHLLLRVILLCQVVAPLGTGDHSGLIAEKLKSKKIALTQESLTGALKNPDSKVRDLAFAQLAFTTGKEATSALTAAFAIETVPAVRLNMAMELAYIGDGDGLSALRRSCADNNLPEYLQVRAVRYIVRLHVTIADDPCIAALVPHLSSDEEAIRSDAYSVLATLDSISDTNLRKVDNQLALGLADRSALVRKAASDAIGAIGNDRDIADLDIATKHEQEDFVRNAMQRNLKKAKLRATTTENNPSTQ